MPPGINIGGVRGICINFHGRASKDITFFEMENTPCASKIPQILEGLQKHHTVHTAYSVIGFSVKSSIMSILGWY